MPSQLNSPYEFASLASYPLKKRLLIRATDLAFYWLIKCIGATVRYDVYGREHLDAIERAGKFPIYAFWHDRIFLGTHFFRNRGIVVMSSESFDGEYIARFIKRFGYGAVRGSSSRGGSRALAQMLRVIRQGKPLGFTVDGPRGPRYIAKPGPVYLAKKSGNPILPFVVESRRYFTIKSWDRLQIPLPFTRAAVIIADPIYVPGDADDTETQSHHDRFQSVLMDLVEAGKRWRAGKG